jgi:hypothetical protein
LYSRKNCVLSGTFCITNSLVSINAKFFIGAKLKLIYNVILSHIKAICATVPNDATIYFSIKSYTLIWLIIPNYASPELSSGWNITYHILLGTLAYLIATVMRMKFEDPCEWFWWLHFVWRCRNFRTNNPDVKKRSSRM